MQDRFKFRFWHKTDKRIQEWGGCHFWKALDNEENLIPMQCTGLKDKNGTLIYEGDIIADIVTGCVAVIKYHQSSYNLMAHIRRMDDFVPIEDICYEEKDGTPFQIIGNIYENPELLKDG